MTDPNQPNKQSHRQTHSFFWPIMLIGIGILLLLSNLDILPGSTWHLIWQFWPLVLIAIGIDVLIGRRSTVGAVISAFLILGLIAGAAVLTFFAPQIPFLDDYTQHSPWQSSSIAHPLEAYQAADLMIDWSSQPGELSALQTSSKLIEGDLTYRGELVFDVRDRGDHAEVQLSTRLREPWFLPAPSQRSRASWKLYLTPEIPLDLHLDTGSGSCQFDLSQLQLSSLYLDSGSGSVNLSLPEGISFPVTIDSGSGNLTIEVPEEAGVRVVLDSGSGSFLPAARLSQVQGDKDEDGTWETDNYKTADHKIDLIINQGSGSITLR